MEEKNYLFSMNMHGKIHVRYGQLADLIKVYEAVINSNQIHPANNINIIEIYEITTNRIGLINYSQVPHKML